MPKFDVTKLNVALDRLLETTANPDIDFCCASRTCAVADGDMESLVEEKEYED